jgi:hypothetical protein
VWCSTDPSVIRGVKITEILYHGAKNASRKQLTNNFRISEGIHVKHDKMLLKCVEICKITGGSDNRPNIISISQGEEKVNGKIVQNDRICVLQNEKMVSLYNIPSCVFEISWYYINTKR